MKLQKLPQDVSLLARIYRLCFLRLRADSPDILRRSSPSLDHADSLDHPLENKGTDQLAIFYSIEVNSIRNSE